MERLRAAHDCCCGLECDADDIVVRLLCGEHRACRLRMDAEHHGFRLLCMEALLHDLCPDAAGGTELRDLFENVVVCVPEEGETACERIDAEACLDRSLDVGDAVRNGECNLLRCRGAGLADVVARDGNRVPVRDVLGAIFKDVRDEAHGRARREDVRTACCILLQNVILDGALELVRRDALLLRHCDVHRKKDGRRRVDRHGRGDLAEIDLVKEDLHISKGVDRNADLADLALGDRIRGVVADLRREVKCAGESRCTALDEVTIALVGLFRRGESCVHAHRPEASAVHRRLHAARVRIDAGETDVLCIVRLLNVERGVESLLGDVRTCRELCRGFFYGSIVLVKLRLDLFIAHESLLLYLLQFSLGYILWTSSAADAALPERTDLLLHRSCGQEALMEGQRLVQQMRCLCALRRRKSTLVVVEQDGAIVGMRAVVDDLEGTLTRAFAA